MRRTLALCATAAVLRSAPAAADPMDLNLEGLGAPAASIWSAIAADQGVALSPGQADNLARESIQRYRLLVLQLGLGLSSFVLDDATTRGLAGFDMSLEGSAAPIRHPLDKTAGAAPFGPRLSVWPVRGEDPSRLWTGALHVQKSLPYSFLVGARLISLNQSQMAAVQAELKWAVHESYTPLWLPDMALRVAYTRLFGQRDLELNVIDVDAMVSKRFAVAGTMRLTPYGVVRMSSVGAKTSPIDFGPTATCPSGPCFPDSRPPATALATTAPFPDMKFGDNRIFRYAIGGKMAYGALVATIEVDYQPGKLFPRKDQLAAVPLPDSLGFALRAGFDF